MCLAGSRRWSLRRKGWKHAAFVLSFSKDVSGGLESFSYHLLYGRDHTNISRSMQAQADFSPERLYNKGSIAILYVIITITLIDFNCSNPIHTPHTNFSLVYVFYVLYMHFYFLCHFSTLSIYPLHVAGTLAIKSRALTLFS